MVVSMCPWLVVGGRRRSQWSSGVLDGRKVGVLGSPMRMREVVLQKSASGVLWEVGCWAGVPWRSPPVGWGVLGVVVLARTRAR